MPVYPSGLVLLILLCVPLVAYYTHSLSLSGLIGALGVGATIYLAGGWRWFMLLLSFFVSATLLSHLTTTGKGKAVIHLEKGKRRDLFQVLANGGVAALATLAYGFTGRDACFLAFLGSLSTVNADTWATEIGLLNPSPPRSLLSGKPVPPGTSGAISLLGTLASGAGALFIGMMALVLQPFTLQSYPPSLLLLLSGVSGGAGSLLDSLLGATMQRLYHCPTCQVSTERPVHLCGTVTSHVRGYTWVNNDVVNLVSALGGAVLAPLLATLLSQ
ncbi:MAG: DUF92 domain-containing protein [Nitrospinota bacterium]|nr:MAG: DUF92 domain-containing protein [Nitrospinota bacterium]